MRHKRLIKPIAGGSFDPLYVRNEVLKEMVRDAVPIWLLCAALITGMIFMFTLLLIKGIITL
jgi:hypothetical protein